jgi:hypothetical protein
MKFFLIVILAMATFQASAQDAKTARTLFESYLKTLGAGDAKGYMELMDPEYIAANGGEIAIKELVEDPSMAEFKGAKVEKVEYMKFKGDHYARFSMRDKNNKVSPLTDNWFHLKFKDGKFLFYAFVSHFDPKSK